MSLRTDCSSSPHPPGMLSRASMGMTPRRMRISVNDVTVFPPRSGRSDYDGTGVPTPPILRRVLKLPLFEGVSLYPGVGPVRGPPLGRRSAVVGAAAKIVARERVEVDERQV